MPYEIEKILMQGTSSSGDAAADATEEALPVDMIKCPRCAQYKPADARDRHICVDCAKAENNRYMYIRQHQGDWMEIAKDAGIDVWLQQPGETQWEYTVWCAFRDSYPGKKPTYGSVAEQLGTTRSVVGKIAQRWTFQARMQVWMAECDRITMEQRRAEILHMNAEHVSMAQRLRNKISTAIDLVDPAALKPSDLSSLMRIATDLERKAQLDMEVQEEKRMSIAVDNPEAKRSPTKQSDLGEVVKILLGAGVLGTVTQIGVRETTTREVVAVDDSGNEARILDEED